jgi:hypothetical protein
MALDHDEECKTAEPIEEGVTFHSGAEAGGQKPEAGSRKPGASSRELAGFGRFWDTLCIRSERSEKARSQNSWIGAGKSSIGNRFCSSRNAGALLRVG